MNLDKTLYNLRETKNSFFNVKNDSQLNSDIIKKNMFFINNDENLKRKIISISKSKHSTLAIMKVIRYRYDNSKNNRAGISFIGNNELCLYLRTLKL
jgi:hypothetical protein